jgi:phosphoribosylaminoimidazolecarboxamide formyltransferase / IMP cyclohydrolase
MAKIERALLSVTDKTGLAEFANVLVGHGVELISTGGTAKLLREAGLPVKDVSEVTGFPEMLDGRVKTIHPMVAGGVLAIRGNAEHMKALAAHGIPKIDMVVVNLYAFEAFASKPGVHTEELIENIDIGGPTMIRAAAKNFQDVAVVTSADDYAALAEELTSNAAGLSLATHWRLAKSAFERTARYDAAITARLARIHVEEGKLADEPADAVPHFLNVQAHRLLPLRYGENPHQSAALYSSHNGGVANGRQLQGKELSYNNLVDLDAAWQLILEFDSPACAVIKHTNPCGCAEQSTLAGAYRRAYEADPVSAFGGVLAFNRIVDEETAQEATKIFTECIAAPGFTDEAVAVFSAKKNLRLLEVPQLTGGELVVKSVSGGFLAQSADRHVLARADAKVRTKRAPTEEEWTALEFGWKVCKHVKSNAIVYARPGQLVSSGAGQMSRVDSVKFGAAKAVLPVEGSVVASDAFFPFPDGLETAASHGITAVIQPGGSVKDQDVIDAADRLGLAMVFTGVRHFRH